MSKARSRITGLRAPFVVTVAVVAGVPACGGTVTDASHGSEVTTGGGSSVGGGGAAGYGGFDVGGAGGSYQGGAPNGGFGANPPATCPPTAPTVGSACGPFGPQGCTYETPVPCGPPTSLYSCVGSVWTSSLDYNGPTCNPPPVMCPAEPPTPGTSCAGPFGPYSGPDCNYGDCYGIPTESWHCIQVLDVGYVWEPSSITTCNPPPPSWDAGTAIPGSQDGGAATPTP